MTDDEIRERLEAAVSASAAVHGTRKSWADAHDLSDAFVCQVLSGDRRPSATIMAALGLTSSLRDARSLGLINEDLLRRRIGDAVARYGSKKAWAAHLGVSDAYISNVCLGKKPPSRRVLDDLGLVLVREERVEEAG